MANESAQGGKSPVEGIKESSRWLRGTLAAEMASGSDHFSEESKQLLKFHGSYQQEDRDARKARSKQGAGKHYMFMIRLKMPAGMLSPEQYLAIDELAGKYANGTIRLTTRQSIQFHGIVMGNLKATIAGMNAALVSTLGGCGDVNRNVMACSAPTNDPIKQLLPKLAHDIAAHLAPKSQAYHDVWLNGEMQSPDADQAEGVEPIYGKVYLPRKFKVGLSTPDDNCIDILTQDLGFLAIIEDGKLLGFNVMVGGGMGRTSGRADTFAVLSQAICFVETAEVVQTAEAVIKFYRDHGNRADRKRARIKYVVADIGVEKVREILNRDYLGGTIRPPKPYTITGIDLHLGWRPQGDGRWYLGLSIMSGRIKDDGDYRLRTALREIVTRFRCDVRATGQQDALLCNLTTADRPAVEKILADHGVALPDSLSLVQKFAMACPAIPTCGLAITESERTLPALVGQMETMVRELGLENELISVRMTGCPNGCARPYQSEIGLVGRSGTKYTMYVGGSTLGSRLNFMLQDLVPWEKIVSYSRTLLEAFKAERLGGEQFGDYCHRQGVAALCAKLGLTPPVEKVASKVVG